MRVSRSGFPRGHLNLPEKRVVREDEYSSGWRKTFWLVFLLSINILFFLMGFYKGGGFMPAPLCHEYLASYTHEGQGNER